MNNILFVCMGNICRSPLAEGVARFVLGQAGLSVALDSAGTSGWHVGEAPDPRARAVARKHGTPIDDLRARQVEAADFERFDLILAADHDNLRQLQRMRPVTGAALELLLDWTGTVPAGEVPDPYYGSERDFEAVYALLRRAGDDLCRRLQQARPRPRPQQA